MIKAVQRFKIRAINYFLFVLALHIYGTADAQSTTPWNNRKAAVVITYDDAINQQLDNAIPVLDSLGLKATFYITGYSPSVRDRLNDWKKIAANGHELGNHTMFHPCVANSTGRSWVKPEYDLSKYNIRRIVDEIRTNNVLLHAMDGKTVRTFAYPCGDMKVNDTAYIDLMRNDFIAARAVRNEMHPLGQIDLYNVDCFVVNGETGEQLIEWAKKAVQSHSLLVILFHGVGGGNSLDVSLPAHRQFLSYLKQNEKDLWITTMLQAAEFIKNNQSH